ncbi:MAG: hypothetical protein ACTSP0_03595 [Alphaproteobacteria bacterium]
MRVQVESYAGHRGDQIPRRFRMDGRTVEVEEIIDQWLGADYRYFKLRGEDGNLYILRLDETAGEWVLILFETPRGTVFSEQLPAQPPERKQPGKPH